MRRRARTAGSAVTRPVAALFALALSALSCSDATAPAPDPVLTVGKAHGDGQEAVVGQALSDSVAVVVTDPDGGGVSGAGVTWQVVSGGGTVLPDASTTDADGETRAQWVLGTTAGPNTLRATVEGAGSVIFTAQGVAGSAAALEASGGDGQTAAAGTPLADSLEVQLVDEHGNPVAGTAVSWEVLAGGGAVSPASATTDGGGRARTEWTLGGEGDQEARAASAGAGGATFTASALGGRALEDRLDEIEGSQVHFIYVLPADGEDRLLDIDGTLARSVASFQNWFGQRSDGLAIRFDTFEGEPDITFFRLSRTDDEMVAYGAFVVTQIEIELNQAGRLDPGKIYLVYYDGGSSHACGGAAWPPLVPGQVAAMYLRGTPQGYSCDSQSFAASPTAFPGYWEFAALHDLIHAFGIVSQDAPNHTADYPAHVPEQNDLMYSGPAPWIINATTVIDVDGDDYFGNDVPEGVANLADSPFVTTIDVAALPLFVPPTAAAAAELASTLERLPVHAAFPPKR